MLQMTEFQEASILYHMVQTAAMELMYLVFTMWDLGHFIFETGNIYSAFVGVCNSFLLIL